MKISILLILSLITMSAVYAQRTTYSQEDSTVTRSELQRVLLHGPM